MGTMTLESKLEEKWMGEGLVKGNKMTKEV